MTKSPYVNPFFIPSLIDNERKKTHIETLELTNTSFKKFRVHSTSPTLRELNSPLPPSSPSSTPTAPAA
jgi:hypothetical protein